jgi:hypothetical protein
MAIAFYCLGTLDVTGFAERKISSTDRTSWKEWIWDQYVGESPNARSGDLRAQPVAPRPRVRLSIRRRFPPGPVREREREQ